MHAADLPITALRELLDSRLLSSAELADACIVRTEAASALNAYASFDAEALRSQARQADARIAAGERLPLLGVPVALKDNIDAVGWPCAAGTGALQGRAPAADAELVLRLRAAGALVAGKAGMHELAFGITNHNAVSGAVHNPWDAERIPGGSSGGSGAVVAARLVPAAIGTDTGGSVRVPAALCGVVGLRPTVGRVPGAGIAPISATRDTGGPLARSVRDCALLDAVLSGDSSPLPAISLRGLRLGVPLDPCWDDLDDGVRACAEAALAALRAAGAELVEMALPGVAEASAEAGFPIALYEFVRDMRHYLDSRRRGITLEQLIAGVGRCDPRGGVPPGAAIAQPAATPVPRRLRAAAHQRVDFPDHAAHRSAHRRRRDGDAQRPRAADLSDLHPQHRPGQQRRPARNHAAVRAGRRAAGGPGAGWAGWQRPPAAGHRRGGGSRAAAGATGATRHLIFNDEGAPPWTADSFSPPPPPPVLRPGHSPPMR
jgi:Asp-tRNA(Asn)/Glu-tRNA(Gln) amidotransferase A subunit family amidase